MRSAVAFVHSIIVTLRGYGHMRALLAAPTPQQYVMSDTGSDVYEGHAGIETTSAIFLGFLLYDLSHVLLVYPRLGGMDTLAHHAVFVYSSVVCGSARVMPFAFSWLIVCELSTPFLNLRWALIHTGLGDTLAMTATNYAFAASFLAVRVLGYSAGIAHLIATREGLALVAPSRLSYPTLYTILGVIAFGLALNLIWFRKIVAMASGKRPPRVKKAD